MDNRDEFKMTGDFRGAIINIKSTLTNVTQSINKLHNIGQTDKEQLEALVKRLTEELSGVPEESIEDADVVATLTEELIEQAEKENPKKKILEIKGENLKKAAENLVAVTPHVVTIAAQIVGVILKMKFG